MSTAKVQNRVRIAYCCPKCGSEISRINKRSIDKLVNMVMPVRRFKCYGCLWEGNRFGGDNNNS